MSGEWETIDSNPEDDLDFTCSVCARRVVLYFNGGEMDQHRCPCGLEYRTVITGIALQMRGHQ